MWSIWMINPWVCIHYLCMKCNAFIYCHRCPLPDFKLLSWSVGTLQDPKDSCDDFLRLKICFYVAWRMTGLLGWSLIISLIILDIWGGSQLWKLTSWYVSIVDMISVISNSFTSSSVLYILIFHKSRKWCFDPGEYFEMHFSVNILVWIELQCKKSNYDQVFIHLLNLIWTNDSFCFLFTTPSE